MPDTAIITGSSRGIGRETAKTLAENGWNVCINCVERTDLAFELATELNAAGHRAIWVQADVSDRGQVEEMFSRARAELGDIGLLVNNAGISTRELFQDIAPESWNRMMDVNVNGVFNCTQEALKTMLPAHTGCIINISSIWGIRGGSFESAYTASKHAVTGLTRALAAELAPSFIRVNAVAPGVIATDMMDVLGEDTMTNLTENMPMGRFGTPADVAQAVLYLTKASYVTGQILTVDGGFLDC